MTNRIRLITACIAVLVLVGCGSSDIEPSSSSTPQPRGQLGMIQDEGEGNQEEQSQEPQESEHDGSEETKSTNPESSVSPQGNKGEITIIGPDGTKIVIPLEHKGYWTKEEIQAAYDYIEDPSRTYREVIEKELDAWCYMTEEDFNKFEDRADEIADKLLMKEMEEGADDWHLFDPWDYVDPAEPDPDIWNEYDPLNPGESEEDEWGSFD